MKKEAPPGRALCQTRSRGKSVEIPTRNKNVGKTKSVGVKPFQIECLRAQYALRLSPLLLTRIMKLTVNPRKKSSESSRLGLFSPSMRCWPVKGLLCKTIGVSSFELAAFVAFGGKLRLHRSPLSMKNGVQV